MSAMASQITSLTIAYSTVYSGADQGKYQSTASLAFVGNSLVTCEFRAQRDSTAEKVSIWWRHNMSTWWFLNSLSLGGLAFGFNCANLQCFLAIIFMSIFSAIAILWLAQDLRGQKPISDRTYFRHFCSLGVNFMQLWFFVLNRFLI